MKTSAIIFAMLFGVIAFVSCEQENILKLEQQLESLDSTTAVPGDTITYSPIPYLG